MKQVPFDLKTSLQPSTHLMSRNGGTITEFCVRNNTPRGLLNGHPCSWDVFGRYYAGHIMGEDLLMFVPHEQKRMKKFDPARALAGDTVIRRDGVIVHGLKYTANIDPQYIFADDLALHWNISGRYFKNADSKYDLFMLKKK